MQINDSDKQVLTKLFGEEKVEQLSGALSSDDGELSLGLKLGGRIVSQEEEKQLREEGVQQGKQIGYKEVAKGLEIDLGEGEKDPVIIADKLKNTLSSVYEEKYKNATPDDKLQEYEEKIKAYDSKYNKLLETHKAKESEIEKWQQEFNNLKTDIKQKEINGKVLKGLPKGLKYEPEDALYLAHKYLDFKEEGEKLVAVDKDTGLIITDGVGEPDTIDNALKYLADKKNWYTRKAGMNGSDSGSGKPSVPGGKTPDEAMQLIKEKGIAPASAEGLKLFKEYTKPVA